MDQRPWRLTMTTGCLYPTARCISVLIFNAKHEVEDQIAEGLQDPVGLAIDTTNRFLYVVDTQQDQVIVYDADSLKLLRRIGTGGKNHFLTTSGRFWRAAGRGRRWRRQRVCHATR